MIMINQGMYCSIGSVRIRIMIMFLLVDLPKDQGEAAPPNHHVWKR